MDNKHKRILFFLLGAASNLFVLYILNVITPDAAVVGGIGYFVLFMVVWIWLKKMREE